MGLSTTTTSQNKIASNAGGAAVETLAAGACCYTVALPIQLASITAAGDVLTNYTPGHRFEIMDIDFAVSVPVTTAARAATLNAEIGTTNVTGGAVALTSANATPLGAVIAGTAITANAVGSATDTLSIEAASVTAFAEGAGYLLVRIKNLDTADAIESLRQALLAKSLITAA